MKRNIKRVVSLSLCAAMAVGSLAGCSSRLFSGTAPAAGAWLLACYKQQRAQRLLPTSHSTA